MRDADLLGRLAREGLVRVTISLTTLDSAAQPRDGAARRLARPGGSQMIRALAADGVPVGVNIAPIVPGAERPRDRAAARRPRPRRARALPLYDAPPAARGQPAVPRLAGARVSAIAPPASWASCARCMAGADYDPHGASGMRGERHPRHADPRAASSSPGAAPGSTAPRQVSAATSSGRRRGPATSSASASEPRPGAGVRPIAPPRPSASEGERGGGTGLSGSRAGRPSPRTRSPASPKTRATISAARRWCRTSPLSSAAKSSTPTARTSTRRSSAPTAPGQRAGDRHALDLLQPLQEDQRVAAGRAPRPRAEPSRLGQLRQRLARRPAAAEAGDQRARLGQELDLHQPAGRVLQRPGIARDRPPSPATMRARIAVASAITSARAPAAGQRPLDDAVDRRAQALGPGDHAAADQRQVLPDPGLLPVW